MNNTMNTLMMIAVNCFQKVLINRCRLYFLSFIFLFLLCLSKADYYAESSVSEEIAPSISILSPRPNIPVIAREGESFSIELKTKKKPANISAFLSLETPDFSLPLQVKQTSEDNNLFSATVPADIPEELYDLILKTDTDSQTCRRCVKVVASFPEQFYFIQITDVHITFPIIADSMGRDNPNALFEQLAEEINIINPAFVLITGDVTMSTEGITRMLFQKGMTLGEPVQERLKLLIKEEFDTFLEILNKFRVPTFVLPGNHDMVGTVNRVAMQNWQDVMSRRYFSFDFSGAHFTGFDNSAQFEMAKMIYDAHPDFTEIDKEQLTWLEEDLKKNQDKKIKILFYHVPYTKQDKTAVTELAGRYGVKLTLAGHLHDDSAVRFGAVPTLWVRTASNLDFGAYRVIRVRGDEIVSWGYDKPLPEHTKQKPDAAFAKYAFAKTPDDAGQVYSMRAYNFDVKYAPANDGTATEVTATITNKTPETFENALLHFYMPKADDYKVSGGKLVQILKGKNFNLCYIKVNITPNSTQTVSVSKQ